MRSFLRFWYDFVIGDDWKIAAGVVIAVALLVAAVRARVFGDAGLAVLGGVLVVVAFSISLVVDTRRRK